MFKKFLLLITIIISAHSYVKFPPAPHGEMLNLCRSKGIYFTAFTEFFPPEFYRVTYGPGTQIEAKAVREWNFIQKNFEPILHVKGFEFHRIATGLNTYNFTLTDMYARKADSIGFQLYIQPIFYPQPSAPNISPPTWVQTGGYTLEQLYEIHHKYVDTLLSRYHDIISVIEVTNEVVVNNNIDTASWYANNMPKYWIDFHRYTNEKAKAYGIKTCLNETIKMSGGGSAYALIDLLHQMKDSLVPIDYIGIQQHLSMLDSNNINNQYGYSLSQQILDSIRGTGYDSILFTEVDNGIDTARHDTVSSLKIQSNIYTDLFNLAVKNKIPVNLWGFNNLTNWRINRGYYLPCLWDTVYIDNVNNDTNYYTMESYQKVKRFLLSTDTCFYNKNRYEIKSRWFKTFTDQDSFCYYLDLNKIGIRKFWNLINTTGSNIFVTDSTGDTLPIYISKLNISKRKGIIEFPYRFSDSISYRFFINISSTDTFNNKNSNALKNAGIVYSPDFSFIDTAIYDKCNNVTLNNLNKLVSGNLTDDGIYSSSINAEAYNSVYNSKIAIPNGTISIFCNAFDTSYVNGLQKRHFRLYDSLGTTGIYGYISQAIQNFVFSLLKPGYTGIEKIPTQKTEVPNTPKVIYGKQYNHVITYSSAGRRQFLNDMRRTPHDKFNATMNFSNNKARIYLYGNGNAANSEIYNIRLYNRALNAFDITSINQMYFDKDNFFQYPTPIVKYVSIDSTSSNQWYIKYNVSINEYSDTVRIILMDSTAGYQSYKKNDSIKGVSSGSYTLYGYSKTSNTKYNTKILVIHEDNSVDTILDSINTLPGTIDTIRLDTVKIKYRFFNDKPIVCNSLDISSRDTVTINGPIYVRDSINIDRISTKILYNSSGKFHGFIYPNNKLYIRTNGVRSIPPILKTAYRTWYIWR